MSKLDQIRALREANHVSNVNNKVKANPKEGVINNSPENKAATQAERQAKWRKANPELSRQRAREGMRKLRSSVKQEEDSGPI